MFQWKKNAKGRNSVNFLQNMPKVKKGNLHLIPNQYTKYLGL